MRRLLFLMSDTGGGHRAACRAIIAALEAKHAGRFKAELVDMWRDYTPWPFNRMPELYGPWINRHPQSYEAQYWVNDRLFKNRVASRMYERNMFARVKHLYARHPADTIICVHSVFVRPAVYALRKLGSKTPFVSVVTDYALPPVLWYDTRADKTLVPTQPAYDRGLELGLSADKLVLTGPVIHPRFTQVNATKAEARAELGWSADARVALLVGGGDGMGPLLEVAQAIDSSGANIELVIVAGRNESLERRLKAVPWKNTVRVYGFTTQMELFMRASDVLISKAGPATITEAAMLGVPMILYGAIQHQESPNAEYVQQHEAGVYAPSPEKVVAALEQMSDPAVLARFELGVQKLAVPDAIWRIADEIWSVDR
jgi:1,2-diacylglycerol 3-beta-galactosyltransferase